jgi:hypothetical protein
MMRSSTDEMARKIEDNQDDDGDDYDGGVSWGPSAAAAVSALALLPAGEPTEMKE